MENGDKIVSTALKAEQVLEIFLQRPQVCSLFRIARLLLQIAARSFKQAPRHDTCTALLTEVELSWLERSARATFGGGFEHVCRYGCGIHMSICMCIYKGRRYAYGNMHGTCAAFWCNDHHNQVICATKPMRAETGARRFRAMPPHATRVPLCNVDGKGGIV